MIHFAVGSLVRARGREWVVLPESEPDLLILRPLGGTDAEVTGIYLPLETVEPAQFGLPDPRQVGDYRASRLVRDAVRLGFRSSAGPFRSFARLAFEPRPYQLVPLLMALKLDPVRLLIADDVGIGKAVEAGLVAKELLDRGEVERLAVLCPPQLAEQWEAELRDKFHIDAELVLPFTATRLERNLRLGQSLFDVYPYVIVSADFIKSDRRRDEFLRTCPELVIVDEAHTCAFGWEKRGGRHQRYELVAGLAANPRRHMVLVTATPHSGNEAAFRSLLTFLNPDFGNLPDDLTGPGNESRRRRLAQYFIQRRRADIRHYMEADTPFPERDDKEETYKLSPDYKRLLDLVLAYARETVATSDGNHFWQRVRWWSALALLRSLASSPAAAAATLRSRAAAADAETAEDADQIGERTVLDVIGDDSTEALDLVPGGDIGEMAADESSNHRRLLDLARAAEALQGAGDDKLAKAVQIIRGLVQDGYHPIVFTRFIPTAEYVAAELRKHLPKDVEVASITGVLPPDEREARVLQMQESERRVLVCTDCLSEGLNLQDGFDSVFHYDLSWNPTRHEQREGRVDRYGQQRDKVRVVTYYGIDNKIDGVVLDVLIRKHRTIRSSLGISVPVPVDTEQLVEAIFEGLLLREKASVLDQYLPGFEEFIKPRKKELAQLYDAIAEHEKRSRTMFAQETIKVDEVARELRAAQDAIGSGVDLRIFVQDALRMYGATVQTNKGIQVDLTETPRALRDALGVDRFKARFELPVPEGQLLLTRTHPVVEGLASQVMQEALDPLGQGWARRCGAIRTRTVDRRTTLLLVRLRYHIIVQRRDGEHPLLAEDCQVLAFAGSPQNAEWLTADAADKLLDAQPDGNILPEQAIDFVKRVVDNFDTLRPHLDEFTVHRGQELLDAHKRVRQAANIKGVTYRVEPQLPPDVLGVYVYLPKV